MDSLPPNDPNQNNNNNNNNAGAAKPDPNEDNTRRQNGGDGTMDVFGDLSDQPVVVAMFLMSVAVWFLQERCTC